MLLVWLPALLVSTVLADTPANCTFNDVAGKWVLYEGSRTYDSSIDCNRTVSVVRKLRVNLKYPNVAVDEFGNRGHWTMIYNEGFEITVNQRTFFAFSYFKQESTNVTSYCDQTFPSWSHDVTLRQWACFYGRKQNPVPPKVHRDPFHNVTESNEILTLDAMQQLVDNINQAQTSWRAEVHQPFVGMTQQAMMTISGGRRRFLHPSSGAQNCTYSVRYCQTNTAACCYRG